MRLTTFLLVLLMAANSFAEGESEVIAAGKASYSVTCIACHGADGTGAIPGVPNLAGKDSPLSKSDEELAKNITEGFQSPGSMMAMPANGGNSALTDDDVKALVAFLRDAFGS